MKIKVTVKRCPAPKMSCRGRKPSARSFGELKGKFEEKISEYSGKSENRPAPIEAEQVKGEFNHRWWKSSAEADKLLVVLVKNHQEDMARFLPDSPKVCREDAIDAEQVKGKALVYESDMRIAVAYLNELFSKHQNNTLFEHMEDEALSSFIAVVLNAVKARK